MGQRRVGCGGWVDCLSPRWIEPMHIVMVSVIKSTSARYWSPEDDVVAPRAQKASLVGTH